MIILTLISLLASHKKNYSLPPGRKVKANGIFIATQPALQESCTSASSLQTEEHPPHLPRCAEQIG